MGWLWVGYGLIEAKNGTLGEKPKVLVHSSEPNNVLAVGKSKKDIYSNYFEKAVLDHQFDYLYKDI